MEKEIVEEISKKYCKNEKFIVLLIKICEDNNVKNIKEQILNFYNK